MQSKLRWRKSSHSSNQGNCVEVAAVPDGGRAVRDSKNRGGPVLTFTHDAWAAFVSRVKAS